MKKKKTQRSDADCGSSGVVIPIDDVLRRLGMWSENERTRQSRVRSLRQLGLRVVNVGSKRKPSFVVREEDYHLYVEDRIQEAYG